MQRNFLAVLILLFNFLTSLSFADSMILRSQTIEGTILRTNGNDVLVLVSDGTLIFHRTNIESVTLTPPKERRLQTNDGLPNFETVLMALNRQSWAANLKQIPATVIDTGPMKNVPYVSFRCSDNFEVNIYGDLTQPAAIEAGVYGRLANDELAKNRCEEFLHGLISSATQKAIVRGLDWKKDLKTAGNLTFEVTPPSAPDAYGGWWISVYSISQLDASRASASELKEITTTAQAAAGSGEVSSWARDDFKLARKARPTRISFRNAFGSMITNAEIVRINEGVSLDWRDSIGTGTVRLSELPPELREIFGYDASKELAESEQRAQFAARQRAFQAQLDSHASPPQVAIADPGYGMGYGQTSGDYFYGGGSGYSGGTVFVRSYTRSDGTYVRSHTRSAPSRGGRR